MNRLWMFGAVLIVLAGCAELDHPDLEANGGVELVDTARAPVDDHLATEPGVFLDTAALGYFNAVTTGGYLEGTSTTGVTWGTVDDTLTDGHCAYAQLENNTGIITVAQSCGAPVAFNQGGWWRQARVCRTGTWTCSAWRWIQ